VNPVDLNAKHIDLIDGVLRNAEHPDTFKIPKATDRLRVLPGRIVKIGFEHRHIKQGPNAERMWVIVKEQLPDGSYVGELNNDPFFLDLTCGDIIAFEQRHILSIYED
jgi:hypothetical protein